MCGIPPIDSLKIRLNQHQLRIQQAAQKSGRDADAITLVAVTKKVSSEVINEAIALGVRDLGENKVQEAEQKRDLLTKNTVLTHHLLGHLQTNKARKALDYFDLIQSMDRPRLAETLDRIAGERGKNIRCLIEVKVSDEEAKTGIPFSEAGDFIANFKQYRHLELNGLMAIAPYGLSPEPLRTIFKKMNGLFQIHHDLFGERPILSMGMTDDFEMAIEEGATMVRIGRGLFGERSKT